MTKKTLFSLLVLCGLTMTAAADETGNAAAKQLTFRVSYSKAETKRGELYQYSERYLGLTDIITEDGESYVLKNVTPLSPAREEQKGGDQKKKQSTIIQKQNNTDKKTVLPAPLNEETLTATNTAKKAEGVAKQIYRLREARTNIVSGEAEHTPADGRAMQLSLQELKEMEAQLTAMFIGTTKTTNESRYIQYNDNGKLEEESEIVLLRFSKHAGPVDADDLSGEPVYLHIKRTIGPAKDEDGSKDKKDKKKKKDDAQPEMEVKSMRISVEYNGQTLLTQTL